MNTGKGGNFHATAIIAGNTGILLTGPSGSGKSAIALALLAGAERSGLFSALVADDQVLLSYCSGRIIAARPAPITGLIEVRGSGIGAFGSISHAVMHCLIRPFDPHGDAHYERMPPEGETGRLPCGGALPLFRLAIDTPDPFAAFTAIFRHRGATNEKIQQF